jgi:hypothetical protein
MLWSRTLACVLPTLLLLGACADPFIESTTLLADTPDTIGPYQVRSVVLGLNEGDKVEVFYNSVDDEPDRYIPLPMEGLDDDGREAELFVGAIPGHAAGSIIRYFVGVDRNGERVAEDPVGGDLRPLMLRISP